MPKPLTAQQVLQKLQQYCAYQERCHAEVVQKLKSFGIIAAEKDEIITKLIADDFLNEQRFATSFVRGKHRIKRWGRIRLTAELKFRGISKRNIDLAMREIDDEKYKAGFIELADNCWNELASEPALKRKKKCGDYLLRKGYESDLVFGYLASR